MRLTLFFALLMSLSIFIFGCSQSTENEAVQNDFVGKGTEVRGSDVESEVKVSDVETSAGVSGVKTLAKNYYRYDKAHYDKSVSEGKTIFLDFHANWCPICKKEQPRIFAAFNELDNPDIVGYEVHYNDGETNADDIELAKKYGITYQYTKVIIDKNGNVALKTLEILNKDRIINELEKTVGA